MTYSVELGPIRPPSEAYSLLIRATINCPWNRCRFCKNYKGDKFQLRKVEEIKQDIKTARAIHDEIKETAWKSGYGDRIQEVAAALLNNSPGQAFYNVALWLYAGGENAFLQDADSIIMRTDELAEAIRFLKESLPNIKRITSYGRAKTARRKSLAELIELKEAGLSRLHLGLESGYDPILEYMDKGVTSAEQVEAGQKIVESGISLSEYVILGLGGEKMWREHATDTAGVLNQINPDFIRVRTLTVNRKMPLYEEVQNGNFIRATEERIIEEARLFIENLQCHSNYISDHINNLLQEVEGKLPQDKDKMLEAIDRFQHLSAEERTNFKIGRRAGIYVRLDDLHDPAKRPAVEKIIHRLRQNGNRIDDKTINALMETFI